jgi:hypothetical protein
MSTIPGLNTIWRQLPGEKYLSREEYETAFFKPLSNYPDYRIRLNKKGRPVNGTMSHVNGAHTRRKNKVDAMYARYVTCCEGSGLLKP